MKKLFILATVCCFAFGLTSCKKEYTCTCTVTATGYSASASGTFKDTKKNAEKACDDLGVSTSAGVTGATASCSLD